MRTAGHRCDDTSALLSHLEARQALTWQSWCIQDDGCSCGAGSAAQALSFHPAGVAEGLWSIRPLPPLRRAGAVAVMAVPGDRLLCVCSHINETGQTG